MMREEGSGEVSCSCQLAEMRRGGEDWWWMIERDTCASGGSSDDDSGDISG